MSVSVSEQSRNSAPASAKQDVPARESKQRFHQATAEEQNAIVEPPCVTPDQKLMSQLLTPETLTQLARRCHADDARHGIIPAI